VRSVIAEKIEEGCVFLRELPPEFRTPGVRADAAQLAGLISDREEYQYRGTSGLTFSDHSSIPPAMLAA
jgi:hypothetical protein